MRHEPIPRDRSYILHGADYNPEQWSANMEIWQEDMCLVGLAHINSLTVGIISWVAIEPTACHFEFALKAKLSEGIESPGR